MNSNKKEGIKDGISVNKNYHVVIPFELLEFLSVDYSYKNKRRFSRLQAFQNLIEYHSTSESKKETMAVNIERLSKAWGWSRPSVMKFVMFLESKNILEIFSVVTSKMVRVRNEIIVLRSENAVEK